MKKNGIIVQYAPYKTGGKEELKFEDILSDILKKATSKLKSEIEKANISLNLTSKYKYFTSILHLLEKTKEENAETFTKYPVCKKTYETINNYLETHHSFNTESQLNNTYFTLKPKYYSNLEEIYDFLANNLYIDDEKFSFEDFKSVLFQQNCKTSLNFNCSTPLIITIIKNMMPLFSDFSRKRIIDSGRFITKTTEKKKGKPISKSIYDTNINRLKKIKNVEHKRKASEIEDFFKQIIHK